jgi:hypothetical protein
LALQAQRAIQTTLVLEGRSARHRNRTPRAAASVLLPRGDRRAVCVHEGAVLVVPLQAFSFPHQAKPRAHHRVDAD